MDSRTNYNNNHNKTALVLEGGAMRGLYTAGVLDVFMQNNIKIDTIFGVSAGALFGINYKSKQIGRALRYNLKYAHDKRYMGMYSLLTTGDVMNREFCFTELVNKLDPLDFETYNNSNVEFYAVVTNGETGEAEHVEIKDAEKDMEYLRASGSMPFVSNLVEINGNKYLDGAIADPIPLKKALDMDYGKIIVIQTRPADYLKKKSWLPFELIYRKYPNFVKTGKNGCIKYNETLNLVKKHEKDGRILVLRPSEKIKMRRVEKNLNKLQAIYDVGVKDCNENLKKIKEYIAQNLILNN
jgi:predicted patatin/cPLA2 family phospholipase